MCGMLHVQTASPTDPVWPRSASYSGVCLFTYFWGHLVYFSGLPTSSWTDLLCLKTMYISLVVGLVQLGAQEEVWVLSYDLESVFFSVFLHICGSAYLYIRTSHTHFHNHLLAIFHVYVVGG